MKVSDENSRIRSRIKILGADPDPYQNVTDPQHCDVLNTVIDWQVAAANDQVEVLAVLLEYGANINLRNNVGWTALHQVGTAATTRWKYWLFCWSMAPILTSRITWAGQLCTR